jgi:hypothetical protein
MSKFTYKKLFGLFSLLFVCMVATGTVHEKNGNFIEWLKIGSQAPATASAALDIASITKGILIPRMTEAQRDAISSPATGLQIYNTDDDVFNYWDGDSWEPVGSGDLVGPASSTDNAVAVWDGTTGKLLKNSSVLINSGDITAGDVFINNNGTISAINGQTFDITTEDNVSGDTTELQLYSGAANLSSGFLDFRSGTGQTTGTVDIHSGTASSGSGQVSLYSGSGDASGAVEIRSGAGNTQSGSISLLTGNASAGNSGDIVLSPGTATGTAGKIRLADSSIGTAGKAWVSTNAFGAGNWGTLGAVGGGTGLTSYTLGDLIYSSATNVLSKLGIGTPGQVLKVSASSLPAWGAAPEGQVNFIKNPSAEFNANDITTSNASVSQDTDSGDAIGGANSILCDASAQNGYCEFDLNTITRPYDRGDCHFEGWYKGDATLYKAQILDGSANVLNSSLVLTNESDYRKFDVTYPCGSSRKVRFTQTEAGTGAAVNLGKLLYGPQSYPTIPSQARRIGSIKYAGASSCVWFTGSTSFGNYSADTDCSNPTVTGIASAPGTKIPAIVLTGAPKGTYYFVATGGFYKAGAVDAAIQYRFSDGTNVSTPGQLYSSTGIGGTHTIAGTIEYTTDQSSVTVNVQGRTGSASNNANIAADVAGVTEFSIDVFYFPLSSETVIRAENSDYDWTSYTPTFAGMGTVGTVNMFHKRVGDTLFIRGSWVNGTVSATTASITLPNSLTIDSTKVPVIQKVGDGFRSPNTVSGVAVLGTGSGSVLQFSLIANASVNPNVAQLGNAIFGSSEAVYIDAAIPITGWSNNGRAPLLVGSITSNTSGLERIERANITINGASSAINSQSGTWISSLTNNSSNKQTANLVSGMFSATPTCVCTVQYSSASGYNCTIESASTSAVAIQTFDLATPSAAFAASFTVNLICMGPR